MNKIFLFAALISIILVLSLHEALSDQILYQLDAETAFTDPYPVEPGQNVELSIEITNNGNKEVENVVVEIEPVEPFTLLESGKKEINMLRVGNSRIIEYGLFIDTSAVSTMYEIPVRITIESQITRERYFTVTKKIQVRVQGTPKFELLGMESGTISPGDRAEIIIKLQNVGSGKAKRTSLTFTSTSDYVKSVLSGGVAYLADVNPGEERGTIFTILASPDSEYGVYTGKINVTYEDESGNELTEDFDVGILISGKPKLQIHKVEADREDSDLTVEIVNIGNAEAKAITAKLMVNDKIFDVDYVTSIKIDRRSTLKFNLPNSMKGKLELSYEGPDNKEYSQTEDMAWVVPFTFPTWIIVIIVLVIAYFAWKKKWYKKIF